MIQVSKNLHRFNAMQASSDSAIDAALTTLPPSSTRPVRPPPALLIISDEPSLNAVSAKIWAIFDPFLSLR